MENQIDLQLLLLRHVHLLSGIWFRRMTLDLFQYLKQYYNSLENDSADMLWFGVLYSCDQQISRLECILNKVHNFCYIKFILV